MTECKYCGIVYAGRICPNCGNFNRKMKKIEYVFIIVLISCIFASGWFINDVYKDYSNKRTLDGLWLKNYNEIEAKQTAQNEDMLGDWVCVNIKGMDYKQGLETCAHEMGHEIFAEFCEKGDNINKCVNLTKK